MDHQPSVWAALRFKLCVLLAEVGSEELILDEGSKRSIKFNVESYERNAELIRDFLRGVLGA